MKNQKVLVTGADGFIGSHLVELLVEKGYDVKAFVYYNSFNTWGWLDTLPKEKLDKINDKKVVQDIGNQAMKDQLFPSNLKCIPEQR